MRNYFQDLIISYLIKRQAPKRVTYTSDRTTKLFGFWVYLGEHGDKYVIHKRIAQLKYECTKMDAQESEVDRIFIKHIAINNGYSFVNDVSVKLYHNSLQISELSPFNAFLSGVTRFYWIAGWLENLKFRKSIKKNERAYSLYCDRLRLLELIIDSRNNQHEQKNLSPDKISHETLLKSMSRASIVTGKGYYTFIEPILKGLGEEGAINIGGRNEIEILPKAWRLVSDYYVDERQHKDNQKSLRWQRYLTALLAIGSVGNIFKDEIRSILFGF